MPAAYSELTKLFCLMTQIFDFECSSNYSAFVFTTRMLNYLLQATFYSHPRKRYQKYRFANNTDSSSLSRVVE